MLVKYVLHHWFKKIAPVVPSIFHGMPLSSSEKAIKIRGFRMDDGESFVKWIPKKAIKSRKQTTLTEPPLSSGKPKEKKDNKKDLMMLPSGKMCAIVGFKSKEIKRVIHSIPDVRWNNTRGWWAFPPNARAAYKLMTIGFKLSKGVEDWLTIYEKSRATATQQKPHIPNLKKELSTYQYEAVSFVQHNNGCALIADDMGLGKTAETIAYLATERKFPALIVTPSSAKYNWEREIKKFVGGVSSTVLSGRKPRKLPKVDCYIINYDVLCHWTHYLAKYVKIKTLVLDESHKTKNENSLRSQGAWVFSQLADDIICLSGTPIKSRVVDIFTTLNMLDPWLFDSYITFGKRYGDPKFDGYGWKFDGATNVEELHRILTNTVMIRRKKEDVLPELPECTRAVVEMELSAKAKKNYTQAQNDFVNYIKERGGKKAWAKAKKAQLLVQFGVLRREAALAKMPKAIEWINDFLEDTEEKLIIFAISRDIVGQLRSRYGKMAVTIDGSTTGEDRQRAVDAFQNKKGVRICVANIQAASEAITLTAANHEVFLELPWSPTELAQAEARAHRVGQKNNVTAWYLLSNLPVEMRLMEILEAKDKAIGQVIDGKTAEEADAITTLIEELL